MWFFNPLNGRISHFMAIIWGDASRFPAMDPCLIAPLERQNGGAQLGEFFVMAQPPVALNCSSSS